MKHPFRVVLVALTLLLLGTPNSVARSKNPRVPVGRSVATPKVIKDVQVGSAAGYATGAMGVLGPQRMAYGRAISTVRFVAGLMSDRMYEVYTE